MVFFMDSEKVEEHAIVWCYNIILEYAIWLYKR